MPKYKVTWKEVNHCSTEIEADNEQQAIEYVLAGVSEEIETEYDYTMDDSAKAELLT